MDSLGGHSQTPSANIVSVELGIMFMLLLGGAVAQLGARLDGIEEVVGSNPIGSTKNTGRPKQSGRLTSRQCPKPKGRIVNRAYNVGKARFSRLALRKWCRECLPCSNCDPLSFRSDIPKRLGRVCA